MEVTAWILSKNELDFGHQVCTYVLHLVKCSCLRIVKLYEDPSKFQCPLISKISGITSVFARIERVTWKPWMVHLSYFQSEMYELILTKNFVKLELSLEDFLIILFRLGWIWRKSSRFKKKTLFWQIFFNFISGKGDTEVIMSYLEAFSPLIVELDENIAVHMTSEHATGIRSAKKNKYGP